MLCTHAKKVCMAVVDASSKEISKLNKVRNSAGMINAVYLCNCCLDSIVAHTKYTKNIRLYIWNETSLTTIYVATNIINIQSATRQTQSSSILQQCKKTLNDSPK